MLPVNASPPLIAPTVALIVLFYKQEKSGYKDALLQPFEQDDKYDQLLSPASMNPKKQKVKSVVRCPCASNIHALNIWCSC